MLEQVMVIAGEVSGDLHGAGVVRALKRRMPDLRIAGVGGDRMKAEGMELVEHIDRLSVMGLSEVVRHLPEIRRVEELLTQSLETNKPQVVVLIDNPGFNLRFARKVKKKGIRLLYYISPQIWAWNRGRVKRISRLVDEINVVFPFEVDLYRKEGINVRFVGHPLLERLQQSGDKAEFLAEHGFVSGKKLLGLFPGSRKQEVERILPVILEAADLLQDTFEVQAAVGLSSGLEKSLLSDARRRHPNIPFIEDATYKLMEHSDAAIVTSGTATLETAWYGTPMVVVYKTSLLTYLVGRMLIRIPDIGLVNIVRGKRIVPELIQNEMTVRNLVSSVGRYLSEEEYAAETRKELSLVKQSLGTPGASERVARNIIALGGSA